MEFDINALQQLARKKNWTVPQFAERLGIEYSYLFRVLHRQKQGGGKLFAGLYYLCQQEGLDLDSYLCTPDAKLSKNPHTPTGRPLCPSDHEII